MDSSTNPSCLVCGRFLPPEEMVPASAILPSVAKLVRRDHPRLSDQCMVCASDHARYRAEYLKLELAGGIATASGVEPDPLRIVRGESEEPGDGAAAGASTSSSEAGESWFGRLAGGMVARAGWLFTLALGMVGTGSWLAARWTSSAGRATDLFPLLVVNLALSSFAALLVPVLLVSQRQREARDRRRVDLDRQRTQKAEAAQRLADEKVDHLLSLVARQGLMLGGSIPAPGSPDAHGANGHAAGSRNGNGSRDEPVRSEAPPRRLKLVP